MTKQGQEETSEHAENEGARDALEHVLVAGLESEISAARSALEEARRLLEGALRRTEEAFAGGSGMVVPAAEKPVETQ